MFDVQTDAIVNTVNLVGVMGKGVALQFKERFPENFKVYQRACVDRTIGIGKLLVVPALKDGRRIYIVNFPTKIHWRNPSEYSYVEKGLDDLVKVIAEYGIKSIAIPPLGAGNGGLNWAVVKMMIERKLADVNCSVCLFEPGHEAVTRYRNVKLTPARALLVYVLDKMAQLGQYPTEFRAVKAIYFMQRLGAQPIFKMEFAPYVYGPYCDSVRHLLHSVDGAYITGFSDMSKKPFEPFGLINEALPEVRDNVESDLLLVDIAKRTLAYLDDWMDDYGLELLSSVDLLRQKNPSASFDQIYSMLCAWNQRKARLFSDRAIVQRAFTYDT